ncbi:MAG: hypothetical protein WBA28_06965 [Microbacteriaceae bacterium]
MNTQEFPGDALSAEVKNFAAAVRKQLADLSPDEVQELTGGLEADLAEHYADNGGILAEPASYAAELRSAAGLPTRSEFTPGQKARRAPLKDDLGAMLRNLRANPTIQRIGEFFKVLQPAWWALRAWVLFEVVVTWLIRQEFIQIPAHPLHWLGLLLAIVISVQFGRHRWFSKKSVERLNVVLSVIAVIALPFAVGSVYIGVNQARNAELAVEYYQSQWLMAHGQPISNIFAYNCAGEPVRDIRLVDQNGNPISLADYQSGLESSDNEGNYFRLMPTELSNGVWAWGVFPLDAAEDRYAENGSSSETRIQLEPPVEQLPILGGNATACVDISVKGASEGNPEALEGAEQSSQGK